MNWEQCRNFGLIEILYSSNALKLYWDRYYGITIPSPNPMMVIESALWQGSNIIVRGHNQYGEARCYIMKGLYEAEQIV